MSTTTNPYRRADFLGARRRGGGALASFWRWSPVVVVFGALPLLHDTLYTFTKFDESARREGAVGLLARIGIALGALLSLRAYDLVVRGPDRGIVDLHPLRAGAYVRARALRAAHEALPLLVAAWALLFPIREDGGLLFGGAVLLSGAWASGLAVGLAVNLTAPALAASPELEAALDVIRGTNPRAQAALIWAPAVALAAVGLGVVAGSAGVFDLLRGRPLGVLELGAPWALVLVATRAAALSADTLARIPAVLAEVDAAYALHEDVEEGRRVYLEWAVGRLPLGWRASALRWLRAGWRSERGWLGGGFLLAGVAFLAGWSVEPDAVHHSVLVGALGAVVLAGLGPRLRGKEPPWLAVTYPDDGATPALWAVLVLWGQVVVIGAMAAVLLRQGIAAAGVGLRVETVLLLVAGIGARGPRLGYVPLALAVAAVGVWA